MQPIKTKCNTWAKDTTNQHCQTQCLNTVIPVIAMNILTEMTVFETEELTAPRTCIINYLLRHALGRTLHVFKNISLIQTDVLKICKPK